MVRPGFTSTYAIMTRRLVAITFLVVGASQVLFFGLLLERGLWAAVPLSLNIVTEICLLRCVLPAPSSKVQLTAWVLTFIAWSVYHLFVVLVHYKPQLAGGGIGIDLWFTVTAAVAWIGSLAMLILYAKRGANH